ncbi:MAG: hypothetical protein AAB116_11550 [Candidatus Poribacteria bacterium]
MVTRVFQLAIYSNRKKILRYSQNDISRSAEQRKNCHPERSEGSSYAITEKLVMVKG